MTRLMNVRCAVWCNNHFYESGQHHPAYIGRDRHGLLRCGIVRRSIHRLVQAHRQCCTARQLLLYHWHNNCGISRRPSSTSLMQVSEHRPVRSHGWRTSLYGTREYRDRVHPIETSRTLVYRHKSRFCRRPRSGMEISRHDCSQSYCCSNEQH